MVRWTVVDRGVPFDVEASEEVERVDARLGQQVELGEFRRQAGCVAALRASVADVRGGLAGSIGQGCRRVLPAHGACFFGGAKGGFEIWYVVHLLVTLAGGSDSFRVRSCRGARPG